MTSVTLCMSPENTPCDLNCCTRSPVWWSIPSTSLIAIVCSSFFSCLFHAHHPIKQLIIPVADCIYKKRWAPRPGSYPQAPPANGVPDVQSQSKGLSAEDDAKLIFGTVFSLRNMVRKLGGIDDKYTASG